MPLLDRDLDSNPYSPDERRVAEWLFDQGVGGGDDPIGYLIVSHKYLSVERRHLRKVLDNLPYCIRQLRHAYMHLIGGTVGDMKQFANGLLAPQIRYLETLQRELDDQHDKERQEKIV